MHNSNQHLQDFYEKTNTKKLEYLYNRLTGVVATSLGFADTFQMSVLEEIEKHFEVFSSDVTIINNVAVEESIWIGKTDEYKNVFMQTSYKSAEGEYFHISSLINTLKKKDLDDLQVHIRVAVKDKAMVKLLCDLLLPHKLTLKSKIYMLTSTYGDLSLSALPTMEVSGNLALNYGSQFLEFHDKLVDSLKNATSGLYLFNGPPGTGKSSYIKYLTTCDIERKIVYIPGGVVEKLTSPELVPLLLENKNIILVIEDAEKALVSREIATDTDVVQTILNLTSGFLGDAANVSIIATFNTDKDKIDAALLRKGRLKLSYEFNKLSLEDTLKLAESLNLNTENITEGMTLADIYHMQDQPGYEKPKEKRVGFF
jgi:hypothetical protein